MKFLNGLGAGVVIIAAMISTKAKADFGTADVGNKNNETRIFEAWCGERGNDCKIKFDAKAILINEKDEVPYKRIKTFFYDANNGVCNAYGFWCVGRKYSFDIVYLKEDGTESVGKILFGKEDIALRFMFNLKNVTGNKPWASDPRCGRGEVFQEGICLAPTTAAEVRTREKESINASNAVIEQGRAIGAGLAVQGELQREGLDSAGRSIQNGLGNVKIEQNTGVIVIPR
jgi:hypothetical protein